MKFEIKKKILKPLCIYTLAFSMLLPSVASLADLDINLGGYSVVYAATVKAPTVNPVFYDATTISGANLAKAKVGKNTVIATVYVSLKDSSGNEKATLSVTPTSGTTWKVDLPEGKKVAKGDTVTVYQQIGEDKSPEVTKDAQQSKASTVTLTMPTGEIWIEQPSSNQVNKDEQAEAVQMLKDANTEIAGDIKSVKFSIDSTDHAYYEVTYTDGSTSGQVEATGLTIKQVTEHSRGATLGSITIVDNVIKGQLAGEGPFDGIKVQILLKLSDAVKDSYCDGGKCLVDKDTSDPVDATVNGETGEFTYTIPNPDLKLDQKVGVTVKEPHKFKSCSQTTVQPVKVEKTEVRDPRKLTAEDKKAIDAAIRKGYTVNGESKLPNGTASGMEGIPAVIQIDDSGNVKIFSGNDVKGTWDSNYNFVPEKNEDGSYKVNDEAEPKITIAAEDLLKNLKPDAPAVKLSGDKKNITITPNEKDTDANSISVSYTGKDGKTKTTTATKGDSGWTIEGEGSVDTNGVISLPKDKVKGNTDVTATVTDKGGIADDDTTPLKSDPGTLKIEETIADKVEALGGLDPVDIKKWVGDEVNWKDGVKAKDDAKKEDVDKLLVGAKFEDATDTARTTKTAGKHEGKIKVKFDDGSEIVVENQKLYVSDLVSPSDKENLPDDALEVQLKLGEGVKAGDIEGNKETPVTAKTYKVKPGTDLSTEKVSGTDKTCFDEIGATVSDDTYVDVAWKDSKDGKDFKATAENNVFTATATKKLKVTVQANGGTGDDKVEYKKSGENFTLPTKDTFTPPANKEFAGWLVGDATTTTEPGTEINITSDTVIKASWKPIMVDVSFDKGEGSGKKDKVSVAKGSEYTLPDSEGFTPPENQKFAGWVVNGEDKKVGDKITVTENTTVTAKYTPIMVDVSFDKGEGTGSKDKVSVAKGSEYTLPDGKEFTPPANKEFAGWTVNGEDKNVGDKITVNENTTVTAKYKPAKVEYNVTFDGNTGTGTMAGATVKKGEKYKLPDNTFGAPSDKQEFKTWEIDGKEVAPGTEITVEKDTVVKAIWKDKTTDTPDPGTPGTEPGTNPNKPNPQDPNQPENPTVTPPTVKENPDGTITVTPSPGTDTLVIPTTDKDGKNPETVVVEKGEDGKWRNENNVPGVTVDPDTGEITIPTGRIVDRDNIAALAKPRVKPGEDDFYIPEFRPHREVVPTIEVYAEVPKTEKVEKLEEVPVSLETHKAYIAGYEDNTLRAEGNITRAEAAAMVTRLAGLDLSDNSMPAFKDMQKNAWYFRYINAAVKANMLDADNGMMRPNDKITRAEFAKMLAAIDKENSSVSKFEDIKGHRYEKEINKIYGNNRIEGYEDGSFRPDAYLTRAESAAFLNRMFNRIADKEAYAGLEDKLARFKDFDSSKWYYDEMVEATNSHELTRRGKASDKYGRVYEKWTRILGSDVR